jgi:VIT1/CCC1 family predicted Fe2+/Mn2+ transporter
VLEPGEVSASFPATTEETGASIVSERARIARLSRIRQLIFGSLDGLLVPLGVISGVAGGTHDPRAVIVAGVAEAFAGALSMGAGEFISARSEAQVQQTEVARELRAIQQYPVFELDEIAQLLEQEGVSPEDASRIATLLVRYPQAFSKTMVEKELGLPLEVATVKIPEALTMGASYIIGSIFPLVAYFFLPVAAALPTSFGLTLLALVVVGAVKGKLAHLHLLPSVLEIVVVGSLSALGGFLIGSVIPHLLGY